MKRIVIVRHAKAAEKGPGINDFKRPLIKKGDEDAINVANKLKNRNVLPGVMISSPANRAIETAKHFASVLNYPADKIMLDEDIYYNFRTQDMLRLISEISDMYDTVFIFGHNPSLSYFATELVKGEFISLPKSAAVGVRFNTETWQGIYNASTELQFFETV